MPRASPPGGADRIERPGKLRAWWHPLLTRLMDHLLSSAYTVQEEVSVGKLPLRVDMLPIRREDGQLSEACRRELSVLLPLLNRYTLVSEHERIISELRHTGHAALLACVLQQIQQFRTLGEDFAMQHSDTQYLGALEEELLTAVLQAAPLAKRLAGLSPEERVRGLSPEERVEGLSPEDVLRRFTAEELAAGLTEVVGLTEEQAAELRKLLHRKKGN